MTSLENKKNENQVIEAYLYASDKARLKDMVSDMGAKASDALQNAMDALRKFDLELADKVIRNDDVIDELEEQIDQECLYSIAMRQPVREDLRFVYSVMKIIVDLERIGDQSVNIAMNVLDLPNGLHFPEEIIPFVERMAEENIRMIREVTDAFAGDDETVICTARDRRKAIKGIRKNAVSKIDVLLGSEKACESDKLKLFCIVILTLRHLSRVSDHVLNLAERVSFIATGISPLTLKRAQEKINSVAKDS